MKTELVPLRPVFSNGDWLYPRPRFVSAPPPNVAILITSWPMEYAIEDDQGKVSRKQCVIKTPPDCNREWFMGTVLFHLGHNYCAWMYHT